MGLLGLYLQFAVNYYLLNFYFYLGSLNIRFRILLCLNLRVNSQVLCCLSVS